jgi:hypothetical protein
VVLQKRTIEKIDGFGIDITGQIETADGGTEGIA